MGTGSTPRDSDFMSFTFTDTSNGGAPQGTVTNVQLSVHVAGTPGNGAVQTLAPGVGLWSWNGIVSNVDCIYVAITYTLNGNASSSGWVNIGWTKESLFRMTTTQVTFNAAGRLHETITAVTAPPAAS